MTGCIHIELLGGPRMAGADGEAIQIPANKAGALVAYLALYPRAHPREQLVEIFWSHLDEGAGRDNLSTTLASLRRLFNSLGEVGTNIVMADRHTISLNTGAFTTDVSEFEKRIRLAGQTQAHAHRRTLLDQARELYTAELLPGIYADWAVEARAQLALTYSAALSMLVDSCEQLGDLPSALHAANCAIAVDCYDEAACAAKMRILAGMGRTAEALESMQVLSRRLLADLNLAPRPIVSDLVQRIRQDPGSFQHQVSTPIDLPRGAEVQRDAAVEQRSTTATSSPRSALPLCLTQFFGRKIEIERITVLLSPIAKPALRLLTLTGPGGVGKTRMSIEVAERLAGVFPGGVRYVGLADISHPRLLPFALAGALNLTVEPGINVMDLIARALGSAPTLLVLDNYEQLLKQDVSDAIESDGRPVNGAAFVRALLECAPALTCLITSRRSLCLNGEREFAISPLSVPSQHQNINNLQALDCVALYVDRAQAVKPDFELTAGNAEHVAALCRRLEGLPLAIEMAAAWARTVPPARMRAQLEQHLAGLSGRHQDLAPRHRCLRATMEWSYNLLTPPQQAFFTALSVFHGGWTVEAAAAICLRDGDNSQELTAAAGSLLIELQEQSLPCCDDIDGEPRFRLLETLREFAWEQIDYNSRCTLQDLHATYYQVHLNRLRILCEPSQPREAHEIAKNLDMLERERENLRAALRHTFSAGDIMTGLRLAIDMDWFWKVRGFPQERTEWAERAFVRSQELALPHGMRLSITVNSHNADTAGLRREILRSLVRELRDRQNDPLFTEALLALSGLEEFPETRLEILEELLVAYTQQGNEYGVLLAMAYLAGHHTEQGDLDRSGALLETCIARKKNDPWGTAKLRLALADIRHWQGLVKSARHQATMSLETYREIGDKEHICAAATCLARIHIETGEHQAGRQLLDEAMTYAASIQSSVINQINVRQEYVTLALFERDYSQAKASLEETLAMCPPEWKGLRKELLIQGLKLALCCEDRAEVDHYSVEIGKLTSRSEIAISNVLVRALVAMMRQDSQAACSLCQSVWDRAIRTDQRRAIWCGFIIACGVAIEQGQNQSALRLLGSATALHAELGYELMPYEIRIVDEYWEKVGPERLTSSSSNESQSEEHPWADCLAEVGTLLETDH